MDDCELPLQSDQLLHHQLQVVETKYKVLYLMQYQSLGVMIQCIGTSQLLIHPFTEGEHANTDLLMGKICFIDAMYLTNISKTI